MLSPTNHAGSGAPPTLLLQAGHDRIVPLETARNLHRRLAVAGVPLTCVEYPATEHAFDLVLPWFSPAAQAVWHDIDQFLNLILTT
jgi:acetyl esterase/lipase